jgi:hypothetical protein
MTPLRKKENLQADLAGLEGLLAITPDDPLATPLMQSRAGELRDEIAKTNGADVQIPETEIFFGQGPVIGAKGIEAKFAGQVLNRFQDIVSNHFAAKFLGVLRRAGRRRGETDSKLYLTALPTGSFGLQLTQPHMEDFVAAGQLAETMEEITGLVAAAGKDDETFDQMIESVHGRVLVPLQDFLDTLNKAGADCKMFSGMKRAELKKEQVTQAYERVASAKTKQEDITLEGTFCGTLLRSGRFEFEPQGQPVLSGWLAEDITVEQAIEMDNLVGKMARAALRSTTISTKSGTRRPTYELISLNPIEDLPSAKG